MIAQMILDDLAHISEGLRALSDLIQFVITSERKWFAQVQPSQRAGLVLRALWDRQSTGITRYNKVWNPGSFPPFHELIRVIPQFFQYFVKCERP